MKQVKDISKFKPLGDRVIIRQDAAEETKKGIVIPDTAKKKPLFGEVIRVGPGKTTDEKFLLSKIFLVLWWILKLLVWRVDFQVPWDELHINFKPMVVKVGDRVSFGQFAGTHVEVNEGEEYLIMREADIFFIDDNATQ